jgi:acyl-CoA thioesterase YciA
MIYRTRFLIKPEDLNAGNTLFGGRLLQWVDEQAAIYAMCQLDSKNIVTKLVSTINFVSPARQKDIIEIGVQATKFGRTSISLHVVVRNKDTEEIICDIENMVFVSVDENGKPTPHGKTDAKIKE